MAPRVLTAQQGSSFPQAKPFAAATPMRTPVKEPGPAATATTSTSPGVRARVFSISWAMTIRVWLWVSPVF